MTTRERYRQYLGSEHWRGIREAKLLDSKNKCENCGRKSGLEVHHKTYERRGCERLSDLQVLCENCHYNTHTKEVVGKYEKLEGYKEKVIIHPADKYRESRMTETQAERDLKENLDAALARFDFAEVRRLEAILKPIKKRNKRLALGLPCFIPRRPA